jgi:molybdopterin-containing oxidoreductase family iron-sulfur binding subunit
MSEMKNNLVGTIQPAPMTLEQVRERLKTVRGKKYWRSVDELANTPEFQAAVEKEFPGSPHGWGDEVSRRGFLKFMGASAALAGLAGCTKQPDEPIYPYIKAPEDLILGKPMYFATAHPFVTGAVPLLVKTDQFRPIKIDGNPEHPYNQGSSDPFAQATRVAQQSDCQQGWDGDLFSQRDDHFADAGAAVARGAGEVPKCKIGAVRPCCCGDFSREWAERSI